MIETQTSISSSLLEWKQRLESDPRNPVFLKDLQWQLPDGISIDPVYDAGSLGPEHAYLKEFHEFWKMSRPDWNPSIKASSICVPLLSDAALLESEQLGFDFWVGETFSRPSGIRQEVPFSDDPISESLIQGRKTTSLIRLLNEEVPAKISVNSTAFHHAGASATEDIAYCLSIADHYRQLIGDDNFREIAPKIVLHLGTGSSTFLEVARLRALRLLWMNLCFRSGLGKLTANIQSESSLIDWSKSDPDGNLLRHTASAMAASLGGADNILIHPHTLNPEMAQDAIRLSVNICQLVLKEARLSAAFDPGSGSYLIEILTHQLSKKAWELFCQWQTIPLEEKIERGFFVQMAEMGAEKLKAHYAAGKRSVIGANKHPSSLARACQGWPIEKPAGNEFPAFSPVFLDA